MMNINPHFISDPNFDRLYVFGAGGHGRELAWLAQQSWGDQVEVVFVVDQPEFLSGPVDEKPVIMITDIEIQKAKYVIGLGSPVMKREIEKQMRGRGLGAVGLTHPRAELSEHVELSEGVVICAGCVLTVNVFLESHVHINLDCTISHDVHIEEFTTLSPGVHVAGNVHIGSGVFIGIGANIINGTQNRPLVIGDGAVIAAGSCVTGDVQPDCMVAGVPAVRKK